MTDLNINLQPNLRCCAEWGMLAEFGNRIDPELNAWTRIVAERLYRLSLQGIIEIVSAYASFMVIYNPAELEAEQLQQAILDCCRHKSPENYFSSGRTVEIPVCYHGAHAPDIENVARANNLSVQDVISIHSNTEYLIYMLGFAPGFPYLGGLDQRLHTPRLETPRASLPAGSVGIAGSQTGIYPLSSPGGWQIIGRTPLQLFNPHLEHPVPYYAPGDKLQFRPISPQEFQRLEQETNHGR